MTERNEEYRKDPDEKTAVELLEGVRELERELASGYEVQWVAPEETEDGLIALGFPEYPEWLWLGVWDGATLLTEALEIDYSPYFDRVKSGTIGPISEADLGALAAWFVYYASGERFSDGHVASGVEDGNVLAMARRLLEIAPNVERIVYTPKRSRR